MDASILRDTLRDRLGTKHGLRVLGSTRYLQCSGVEVVGYQDGLAVYYRGERCGKIYDRRTSGRDLVGMVYTLVADHLNQTDA